MEVVWSYQKRTGSIFLIRTKVKIVLALLVSSVKVTAVITLFLSFKEQLFKVSKNRFVICDEVNVVFQR